MTTKSTQSMIYRFSGRSGRHRLVDSICRQPIVAGKRVLAEKLAEGGCLLEILPGKEIITQGNSDNDLYLIISGHVAISVNGRVVANRSAGNHVGEMALLDPTARRSATVTAVERTTLLQVAEPQVSNIAKRHPEFWRRIAVELASRLRERGKSLPEPHTEPVIFIGSSTEGLREATFICQSLGRRPTVPQLWTEGVFQLSKTTIEDLWRMTADSDFAVIVLTADDITVSRGKRKPSPRDNVVFELGLFIGALGRQRSFIVIPRGIAVKIPTDLLGVTLLQYRPGGKKTLGRRLQPVTRALWKTMKQIGPK